MASPRSKSKFLIGNPVLLFWGSLGLTLLAWLVIQHINDSFQISHTAATWMAFAQAAADGNLYPPLIDSGHYAGTRYMPIPLLLHAAGASLSGEFLTSGKMLSAICMLIFMGTYWAALRSVGVEVGTRLFWLAVVCLSGPGIVAAISIRNDVLPLALQLLAMLCFRRRYGSVFAGVICAAAFWMKISALWAFSAIGLIFLLEDWRRLISFLSSYGFTVLLGLACFQWISEGRMLENFISLAAPSNQSLFESLDLTTRSYRQLARESLPTLLLLPFALFAVFRSLRRYEVNPWHVAFFAAGCMTIALYTDRGVWMNHLIDIAALTPVVFCIAWNRYMSTLRPLVRGAIFFLIICSVFSSKTVRHSVADTYAGIEFERNPFVEYVVPASAILTEDPFPDVMLGRRPVVLDSFMFQKIATRWPEETQHLADQILQQQFDLLILITPIHRLTAGVERKRHFDPKVWQAILSHYHYVESVGAKEQWHLYRPNGF